jgi:hypothetical protein
MQAIEPPGQLAASSQAMAPMIESQGDSPRVIEPAASRAVEHPRAATAPATASEQAIALAAGTKASARRLPLPGVDENEADPETEIDPLASRQGEASLKRPSIWNNPQTFEPDEPSVVVRSKSLVLETLAAEAARMDAEDAREDAEPPTRVEGMHPTSESRADSNAQTFVEQTEIEEGPTSVGHDGSASDDWRPRDASALASGLPPRDASAFDDARATRDSSAIDDGPTRVMPDGPTNEAPPPPSAMPVGWSPPMRQRVGPPERGSQEIITPLPPPPLMPEVTDYPRVRRSDPVMPLAAPASTPAQMPGWMPAAPTLDERPMSSRKKWIIVAGAGALLLVAIIVFATRGGDEPSKAARGSDAPRNHETATPTETATQTPTETGTGTPEKTNTTNPDEATPDKTPTTPDRTPKTPDKTPKTPDKNKSPDKTTPRPTTKLPKTPTKVATKPAPSKAPPKKLPPKAPPTVKKPAKKEPAGWDPNSLFPKKK